MQRTITTRTLKVTCPVCDSEHEIKVKVIHDTTDKIAVFIKKN